MKKIFLGVAIIIFFLIASLVLTVDVPVYLNIGGRLNFDANKIYIQKIKVADSFNSAIFKLNYNKSPNDKVVLMIYKDSLNNKPLVEGELKHNGVINDLLYKLSFPFLAANKNYILVLATNQPGNKMLRLSLNAKEQNPNIISNTLNYRLYTSRSIYYVVSKACQRAATDWFRFGWLYLLGITSYIILLSALLSQILFEKRQNKV